MYGYHLPLLDFFNLVGGALQGGNPGFELNEVLQGFTVF